MPRLKPAASTPLLVVLGAFLIVRGFIPAFTQLDTDFPNYYTAGRIAASGEDTHRLYDDQWFQEQIHALGMAQQGKFSPFPPPTALLFIPLSFLSPLAALQVMTALNIGLLVLAIVLMRHLFQTNLLSAAGFALLAGHGLVNCFRFGQLYLALTCSILAGYYFLKRERTTAAGVSFGVLAPVKYFPLLFLAYHGLRREWSVVVAAASVILVIVASSVAVLGWDVHAAFIGQVAGTHLQSQLSGQDPFASVFQSFDSMLRRMFVHNERLNPSPAIDAPVLFSALKTGIVLAVIGLTAVAIILYHRRTSDHAGAFMLLSLGGLLVSPASATYHMLVLWLPVGLLLVLTRSHGLNAHYRVALASYAAIGFIPYSFFRQFEGGWVTPLAHPRLFLLVVLFGTAFSALRRVNNSPARAYEKHQEADRR